MGNGNAASMNRLIAIAVLLFAANADAYLRKCEITVDNTQVVSTETGFVVLLSAVVGAGAVKDNLPEDINELLDADGSFPATASGGDIRCYEDEALSIEIPREIVSFSLDNNPTNGTAQIWAKRDVSSSVDTPIWITWDGVSSDYAIDATYGAENVWTNYAAVYHCDDASGNLIDSTSNDIDLAATGTPTYGVSGQVGNAIDLDLGDYFSASIAAVTTEPATFLGWFNSDIDGFGDIVNIADASETSSFLSLFLRGDLAGDPVSALHSGAENALSTTGYTINTWHHGASRFVSTSNRFAYIDGGSEGNNTDLVAAISGIDTTGVGRTADSTPIGDFDGTLDEIHIYGSDIGLGWIETMFNTSNSPITFASAGTPEDVAGGGTPYYYRARMMR